MKPQVVAIDLSAYGTANCYIVSDAGTYKFKTVMGNSSTSVGVVNSVAVLWESFGTDTAPTVGDLIKTDLSYADNYIIFKTGSQFPTQKGNAVIAAKDAGGNILWSWHIWLADAPVDQTYRNSAGKMMDRNLGATSAEKGKVGALGLMYQWGRKDPFLGSDKLYYSSNPKQAASTNSWPAPIPTSSSVGTISYAVSNPMTFITSGNTPQSDWKYSQDNTLWQETKTIYDPCPPGYRVPQGGNSGVWKTAFNSSSWTTYTNWDGTNMGMDFAKTDKKLVVTGITTCWYPASGRLIYTSGRLSVVGTEGFCFSCTPSTGYTNSVYILYFKNDGSTSPSSLYERGSGRSVRCLKE